MCIAYDAAERTLNTALNVLVLGLKCAIVLKYSIECLFFCKGYSGSESAMILTLLAFNSNGCFAFSVFTKSPVTVIDELNVNLQISSKLFNVLSKTICKFLKKDPSLISINPNVLESLTVLTHPETCISFE